AGGIELARPERPAHFILIIIIAAVELLSGGRILPALEGGGDRPFGAAPRERLGGRGGGGGRHDERGGAAAERRRVASLYETQPLAESLEKPLVKVPDAVLVVIVVLGAHASLSERCQQNQCEHAGPCFVPHMPGAERFPHRALSIAHCKRVKSAL